MDLEHLNKSQIILLTLLVSFVTSIATGIVTVTLMEQAPPAITQTVNRIVERTVERVVPQESQVAAASNVITEKTVIVRETDLIAKAVASIEPSLVRLYTVNRDEHGKDFDVFLGFGIVANADGVLYADSGTPDGPLFAVRADGIRVQVKMAKREAGVKAVELQAPTTTPMEGVEEIRALSWQPALFSTAPARIGETVVAIGGRSTTRIADGIITALSDSVGDDGVGTILETSIGADSFSAGSPLINTDGEIIGMATRESREGSPGFLASSRILLYNNTAQEEQATATP